MPSTEDIISIADNVMRTMMQAEVSHDETQKAELPSQDQVTGCVQISGEWTGAVLLKTSLEFATLAASNLLAIPREEVVNEDRQDAMAELANMIGGNIKSILPGPSYLSLPSVTIGKEFEFKLFGTSVVCDVPMVSFEQSFHVVISQIGETANLEAALA
ncbi:MAG TPA: chemotaxis protein CheX [Planctomycetaceae bacterium]|nr:chemotaxis protein CheX [Planctomycetaceae bacterium]